MILVNLSSKVAISLLMLKNSSKMFENYINRNVTITLQQWVFCLFEKDSNSLLESDANGTTDNSKWPSSRQWRKNQSSGVGRHREEFSNYNSKKKEISERQLQAYNGKLKIESQKENLWKSKSHLFNTLKIITSSWLPEIQHRETLLLPLKKLINIKINY